MTITLTPGKQLGLRRMADAAGRFKMTAVDQRPPIKSAVEAHRGGPHWEDVARVKTELLTALQPSSTAMLMDPHYAIPHGWGAFDPAKGLIVTLEDSPLPRHRARPVLGGDRRLVRGQDQADGRRTL